ALEKSPATPVRSLDILPAAERRQLLTEWNATEADYPHDQCIHELFEAQAAANPGAIAVVDEESRLTYAELNSQANQLAHHLRKLGVKPDARVAICAERSPEMVVGLLAILKAGGAYVPLDPAYPVERLTHMLRDCAPVAVLTHSRVPATVHTGLRLTLTESSQSVPLIDLQPDTQPWSRHPHSNHPPPRS